MAGSRRRMKVFINIVFVPSFIKLYKGVQKSGEEEDEAQKIYREIIEVVSSASPASLQYVRGRMVGYGEEAGATLRRAARGRQERAENPRGQPGVRHGGRRWAHE